MIHSGQLPESILILTSLSPPTKIQTLSEEKEAHEAFMLMRAKQQEDERHQFRKVWKRRRAEEKLAQQDQNTLTVKENIKALQKLRRLQRYGYSGANLAASKSPALTCQA